MQGTRKTLKLLIVGDGGCGKTCLLKVFSKGTFPDAYDLPTFDSYEADIEIDGNQVRLLVFYLLNNFNRQNQQWTRNQTKNNLDLLCFTLKSTQLEFTTKNCILGSWRG